MDTMEENWLPVAGYEGLYEVSDLGRVKSLAKCGKQERILKPKIRKDGYLGITLTHNKKQNVFPIHRLVLQTFQPTKKYLICDHKNHIKNDNRLCNLRWATISENTRFQKKRKGLTSKYIGVSWAKGNNKWRAMCSIENKLQHIGLFDDEREAGKAYNEFIIKHNLQDFVFLNDLT